MAVEKKYQIDTQENREFLKGLAEELLVFGSRFPSPEGSTYYLGDDGTPWKDRNRDTYENGRMAHCYTMGKFLGYEKGEELAKAAIKGLTGELHDKEHGGWYSGVAADGTPLQGKWCYTNAFVILGAASVSLLGYEPADELLKEALITFDRYFWDEAEGLTRDTWNTDFTVLDDYRGINANMHTVEAFLAVADVTGREEYRDRAGRIIKQVVQWAEDNEWRIPEHYTRDWIPDLECNREKPDDQFKPYGATPGHGLEWARLITQWALSFYKEDCEEKAYYLKAAESLYKRAVADGWNSDGAEGIVYTTGWDGKPIVHDRMQWVLAEAINTASVLYRVTGKTEFAEDYGMFMKYLDEKVLDHENGSWFHQLNQNNEVIGTVWPGKPDIYHALQATLIPYAPADVSIAVAVKKQAEK
ncbi:MAG: AGE family epimerase/isomerase [Eubacteriales bacterium]|nr:AGE family epimerase/isomerase [Eubacteriales bacterium]